MKKYMFLLSALFLFSCLSALEIKNCTNCLLVVYARGNHTKGLVLEKDKIMHSRYLNDMNIFVYRRKVGSFFPGKKFAIQASRLNINKKYNVFLGANSLYLLFYDENGNAIRFSDALLTSLQS